MTVNLGEVSAQVESDGDTQCVSITPNSDRSSGHYKLKITHEGVMLDFYPAPDEEVTEYLCHFFGE